MKLLPKISSSPMPCGYNAGMKTGASRFSVDSTSARSLLLPILTLVLLLAGCLPAASPPEGQLHPITADGARLLAGGALFEVRGVDYIHPSTANLAKCPPLQFGADGNCPWA